jgi:hypothetical protein
MHFGHKCTGSNLLTPITGLTLLIYLLDKGKKINDSYPCAHPIKNHTI